MSEMTRRERVTAAFRGEEPDRVPVCMWQHIPPACWGDDDRFVEYQIAQYRNTGVDFMKMSADKYFTWPSPVLENIGKANILYRMEPLRASHPHIRGQIERAKKVIGKLNGECVAIYLVFAPLCCLRQKVGYPAMMRLMSEDPEAVRFACGTIAESQKLLVKGLIEEAGVDGIFFSIQNAEENRFTEEVYRTYVTPAEKAVLDYANTLSDMNAIHFCAWEGDKHRLSVWADYHAPVVSWSRQVDIYDISEAKQHFGCTVWGGFDNRPTSVLGCGTREQVEAETASILAQGGRRNFILGADCSIYSEIPEERIRWVTEAAEKLQKA